ncbi:MAG: DUF3140 domain-containing protein [Micromonosporaceae bacterium]|jgi:hypothetical protein|nr:DUF3140 domain-containing protein [Micromonosporaceae bacterium]
MDRDDSDVTAVWDDFHRLVNMPSDVLRDWLLETPGGVDTYAAEPDVDIRGLGDCVLEIMGKRREDLTGRDVEVMGQVVDEISQLLENRPEALADRGPWRDTLMTLGHDPGGDQGDDGSDI